MTFPIKHDEDRLMSLLSMLFKTRADPDDDTTEVVSDDDVAVELRSFLEKYGNSRGTMTEYVGTKKIEVTYSIQLLDAPENVRHDDDEDL
jgi:hypothetical protein